VYIGVIKLVVAAVVMMVAVLVVCAVAERKPVKGRCNGRKRRRRAPRAVTDV
jgi:hypothetical protein